jgi:hypothetical protein
VYLILDGVRYLAFSLLQVSGEEMTGPEITKKAIHVERKEAGGVDREAGTAAPARTRRVRFSDTVQDAVENLNQVEQDLQKVKEPLQHMAESRK